MSLLIVDDLAYGIFMNVITIVLLVICIYIAIIS